MRLANKVALITGAYGGMGRATARLFAKEGASVVLAGRNEERGHALEKEINDAHHEWEDIKVKEFPTSQAEVKARRWMLNQLRDAGDGIGEASAELRSKRILKHQIEIDYPLILRASGYLVDPELAKMEISELQQAEQQQAEQQDLDEADEADEADGASESEIADAQAELDAEPSQIESDEEIWEDRPQAPGKRGRPRKS